MTIILPAESGNKLPARSLRPSASRSAPVDIAHLTPRNSRPVLIGIIFRFRRPFLQQARQLSVQRCCPGVADFSRTGVGRGFESLQANHGLLLHCLPVRTSVYRVELENADSSLTAAMTTETNSNPKTISGYG